MSHRNIRGVVVITRNGDRQEFYQDPKSYKYKTTETTPLGAQQSFQLGQFLRNTYIAEGGSAKIKGISEGLVNTKQVYVRAKAGGEGNPIFDNGIALLQGLYPPTDKNSIKLANGTTITAPLGGYQYVPVETVEPHNDRSLEPWTDCPKFQKHVEDVQKSDAYKKKAAEAGPYLRRISDFVWGPSVNFDNMWNVYDYVHAELTHNKTYAHRLPPGLIDQSRAFVNWHQDKIFGEEDPRGIANIGGRTILHSIIKSLNDIAWDGNPLQLFVQETTYQPFISLFHMLDITDANPKLAGVPNFASALAIELRRGSDGDDRDYVRFKFKNGTTDSDFQTIYALGHKGDIPLAEFAYKTQSWAINNNREWANACGRNSFTAQIAEATSNNVQATCTGVLAFFFFCALFIFARARKARQAGRVRLPGPDALEVKA